MIKSHKQAFFYHARIIETPHQLIELFTRYTSIKIILLLLISTVGYAQTKSQRASEWGDQLNGSYKNPILNADYSDPDVIKLGDTFYMVCSDFHFMGLPILKSTDLVNWTIVNQIYTRLDIHPKYNTMERYGGGSWAPSLRYHNKKFYVYFCTPDEGLYMCTASDPAGKWSAPYEVKRVSGWEDPCPFWDEDGRAYLGHSKLGAGPIILHKMSADGKKLLDSGKTVYTGPVAEGTKIYKRNNYYYIIIPEGGVGQGYETALRSKNIYGPYQRKVVLERGKTDINGPHQGGWVELASGESWFIHFQDVGALGRICHLEPVKWVENWPMIGEDWDGNGIGEPVAEWRKPNVAKPSKIKAPQTSDEFSHSVLGLQWQWNHNPVDHKWSVRKPKGYLSLQAMHAADLKHARNTLTQKLTGNYGIVTTLLNTAQMAAGQKAGLCLMGSNNHEIGIVRLGSNLNLYANNSGKITEGISLSADSVYLRAVIDLTNQHTTLQYSEDGNVYHQLGELCTLSSSNYWKGLRPGLFSYNINKDGGTACFAWFHYQHKGPLGGL
jgi:beta-xylosidase